MSEIQTYAFAPEFSSDDICFGEDITLCLTDVVNGKADIDHTHTGYASTTHTHTEYVSSSDLTLLEDIIDTKANETHIHSEYASSSHSHSEYATVTALDTLGEEVDGKASANHTHTEYASSDHVHDEYALTSHSHSDYADISHTHDYAPSSHTHTEYATITALNEVSDTIANKANTSHSHDDVYYTEVEVDTKLAAKADSTHTHTGVYEASGAAASALSSANAYTDSKIDALVGEGASTTLDTIGEISSAIEDNQDAIDLLNNAIANKANTSHSHVISEVTSLQDILDDKASSVHNHSISDITNLQSSLNAKAAIGHNHDEVYYTETEIDTLLSAKSDNTHSHDYVPTSRTVNGKSLGSNIVLSASDVGALSSDTDIPSALSDLADDSTHRIVTDAEKAIWNAKSDFSGSYNDLTDKPSIPSISGLATETYVDTQIDAIDIPNALSDLTTDSTHRVVTDTEKATWNAKSDFSGSYNDLTNKPIIPSVSGLATETFVNEAVSEKANVSHTHVISDISNLQDALDTKATQTSLDTHTSNTIAHVASNERTNWNAGYTHSQTAHAPSNAEANQNAFSNVIVGSTTIAADSATDTLTFVAGANVTITPDATNDKITISATDTNTTYSAGTGISLSGTTFSNSGVRSVTSGSTNGTISVNTNGVSAEVAVKGLGSAAYTSSTAYDAAGTAQTKANAALASAKEYADNAAITVKNDLLNGAGTAYDTLKELGDLIDTNVDAIEALEAVAAGKANASHTHAISEITNLQTTLDGKASASHGTHVTYSTTVPTMDGAASVGSATTVARSDHKHPTDTSRAAQTDLDALETVVSGKANTSHTHAISEITNLQTSLDSKQATITGGATTIASSNLAASRALISNSSGKVAVSDVTSTELGYLDGVSSNIQTQLDAKASSSHTHSAATTSAAGLMSASDKTKLDGIATGANAYTHPAYTARTGVPTANATLSHGGTFTVTQPVCDATGHITAMNTRTYTLPSDNNTDTKVTNTLATTTKAYITGTTSSSTNTGTQVFDTGVYLDTTAGQLTATTFNGTTFKGSGVATVAEVETYLNI